MIFQREAAAHFAGSVSPFQVRIHHRSLPGAMISVTLITDDTLILCSAASLRLSAS